MAIYTNPQYYSGPLPSLVKMRAKDSQTWQAGQFVRNTDSGVALCKSNASSIMGLTAQNQATATSSTDVWIHKINSSSTKFKIGVTSGGSDAKAGLVDLGSNEGLAVNSCICTLSKGNDSTEVLHIHDVMGRVEPQKNDTNDSPGFAIVSVMAVALDAEGAGI